MQACTRFNIYFSFIFSILFRFYSVFVSLCLEPMAVTVATSIRFCFGFYIIWYEKRSFSFCVCVSSVDFILFFSLFACTLWLTFIVVIINYNNFAVRARFFFFFPFSSFRCVCVTTRVCMCARKSEWVYRMWIAHSMFSIVFVCVCECVSSTHLLVFFISFHFFLSISSIRVNFLHDLFYTETKYR